MCKPFNLPYFSLAHTTHTHCQQKNGSSSAPPTHGYTPYPSFPFRQGLCIGPCQLASALLVANLDHGGPDGMVSLTMNNHTLLMFADLHTFIFEHSTSGRHALTDDMAKTVAASFMHTRINYVNALHGSTNIKKLQRVQTSAARVVLLDLSQLPATALLSELHWIPVTSRITFKLACLTYKLPYSPSVNLLIVAYTLLHYYTRTRTVSTNQFLPCHAMLCTRGLSRHAVSICLSVCLSRSYILSKRINISSNFFHRRYVVTLF